MQDLELKLGIPLTYIHSWRMREFVKTIVLQKPVNHYKLLPWICTAIARVNLGLVVVCEVDGYRFYRMLVACAANVNNFKLRCRFPLFIDGSHMSRPYKGTFLVAYTLDANNHLFNFTYVIVCGEKIKEWVHFLEMVANCCRSVW